MTTRHDITIPLPDGVTLAAWLFVPDGGDGAASGPLPTITMAHGFAGTRNHGLEPIARRLCEAGFVVVLHDHRNFGGSEGTPRQDIDPHQQIEDWHRVIAHLQTLDVVDANRIGLWGSSYSGGHALVLGATNRTLKCVYAQVPTIDGFEAGRRRVPPHAEAQLEERFRADLVAQARGEEPARQAVASADPDVPASYRSPDAVDFYLRQLDAGDWTNDVTIQSNRRARSYVPGIWAPHVSPTPLLMLVAEHDVVAPTDLALEAYERAREPKQLVLVPGGHFDPYEKAFEASTGAAVEFFTRHLVTTPH